MRTVTPGDLVADESGTTAVEYALIGALVAVAAVGAFVAIGQELVHPRVTESGLAVSDS